MRGYMRALDAKEKILDELFFFSCLRWFDQTNAVDLSDELEKEGRSVNLREGCRMH